MNYIIISIILLVSILIYFKIAEHFNIVDRPNERSSHHEITIRGGGIIYLVAALLAAVYHPSFWLPVVAMFIIGIISFIDDRFTLSRKIRITFHLTAVTILFYFLGIFAQFPIWVIPMVYILVIGVINAYNFMDGINGITGLYSLTVLASLQYINYYLNAFTAPDLIWIPIIATLIFLFFNFRKRAKCFAGDVGSVTIAFWILMLLIQLMMSTGTLAYILFLAVYGVDAVLTIMHRLYLKQNILNAHRLHFYQILANEKGWSHLKIASIYAFLQVLINLVVINFPDQLNLLFLLTLLPLVLAYIIFKPGMMKSTR